MLQCIVTMAFSLVYTFQGYRLMEAAMMNPVKIPPRPPRASTSAPIEPVDARLRALAAGSAGPTIGAADALSAASGAAAAPHDVDVPRLLLPSALLSTSEGGSALVTNEGGALGAGNAIGAARAATPAPHAEVESLHAVSANSRVLTRTYPPSPPFSPLLSPRARVPPLTRRLTSFT
jgi:hypothetical protein